MNRPVPALLFAAGLSLFATTAAPAKAPVVEHWTALSHTATGITGDIALSPTALVAAHVRFPLRVVADVPSFKTDTGETYPARILQVTRRVTAKLLFKNTLCDPAPRWIVVYHTDPKTLGMAVFNGAEQPTGADTPGLCATYSYSR